MNCFEWKTQISDFLDGTLPPNARSQNEKHLESCDLCSKKFSRYRQIQDALQSQPRSGLPISIRKNPKSFATPKFESSYPRTRWQRTPWFIRTSLEGIGIAGIVLITIALIPRLRAIYDIKNQKQLEEFNVGELSQNNPEDQAPSLVRGKQAETSTTSEQFTEEVDEPELEGGEAETEEGVTAGRSEIWRFNLKSDSPSDLRVQIVEILKSSGIQLATPGASGLEAPGGIQFDITTSADKVGVIKQRLTELYSKTQPEEELNWYKSKSRTPIPQGQTRIVIWLSQI